MPKQFKIVICIFCCMGLTACSKYHNNPDLRLARDFIDSYYVMADQKKALLLTTGQASDELKEEIKLTQGIPDRQNAYRSRTVSFDLVKEIKTADEVVYLFKLTITVPDMDAQEQMIHIAIDRPAGKIKYFGSLQ